MSLIVGLDVKSKSLVQNSTRKPKKILIRAVCPALQWRRACSKVELLQERRDNFNNRCVSDTSLHPRAENNCCGFHVYVNALATNRGTTRHNHTTRVKSAGEQPQLSTYVSTSMNGCSPRAPEGRAQIEVLNTSSEHAQKNKVPTCGAARRFEDSDQTELYSSKTTHVRLEVFTAVVSCRSKAYVNTTTRSV